jgi:hypothetical protein
MPRCPELGGVFPRMTLSQLDVVVDSNADERFENTLNASSPTAAPRQVRRECRQKIGTDLWPVNQEFERRARPREHLKLNYYIPGEDRDSNSFTMTDHIDRGIEH